MTVSVETFKEAFPEFEETEDTQVQAKLDEAVLRVTSDVWEDLTDTGIKYLTAHLLAISPWGQQARMEEDDGETTYNREFKRLQLVVGTGARVI